MIYYEKNNIIKLNLSDMVGEAIKTYNNNTQIREKRRYKVDNGVEETEIEEE